MMDIRPAMGATLASLHAGSVCVRIRIAASPQVPEGDNPLVRRGTAGFSMRSSADELCGMFT